MKKFKVPSTILLVLLTIGAFNTSVLAHGESINTELKEYTQNPESKIIKYELILESSARSDNVRVTWTITGNSKTGDAKTKTVRTSIEPDKTYTLPIEILPSGQGTTELTAKAEVFQVDGTLTSTVRTNFATNQYGEKLPLSSEYNQSKTLSTVKNVVLAVTTLVVVATAGYFGFKQITLWYKKKPSVDFVTPEEIK
jgi:hypothetical protein